RYRKEATGGLDEVAITEIRDRAHRLAELEKRRAAVLASCGEQGVLSESLKKSICAAKTPSELEDLYLPYRPKRRTRAMVARERGLAKLAVYVMKQESFGVSLREAAEQYLSPEAGVATADDALSGARDIIAESISEHPAARGRLRRLFEQGAVICASAPRKMPDGDSGKYSDYYASKTSARNAPSHRILALLRGEREGFLSLAIEPDENAAVGILRSIFIRGEGEKSAQVDAALIDAYKRLLRPSMETELRASLKEAADDEAIKVFARNLRALLMASPYGGRSVLALDPGFRSGCKIAVLDERGDLLHHETVYPHPPQEKSAQAGKTVVGLVEKYGVEAAAVGNGTAGRETEAWLASLKLPVEIVMVSENGASVYSASEVAREEFPDLDLTVRGAVSIGRRLQDPLAELVKIDPKAIGVGQYQHDVDQKKLKGALDDVVSSCVNQVGVDINRASRELLGYVSGLNARLAANIVGYRRENGAFRSREDFRKIPRMGPKAFEQSAGFMRIRGGDNPLDASAVHPENYGFVGRIAVDLGCSISDLMQDDAKRARMAQLSYPDVGRGTMLDILSELAKPGRDPRDAFESFSFDEGARAPSDLMPGMKLPGIVTNVTAFGAFVDIGVHRDGLLHKNRVKPDEMKRLAPGLRLTVEVIEIDEARGRISLGLGR
ncbi:MAG: RNA-binding transcriptional accessory protein, partial [Synergistaceae bacterium]|nr:RNA-binding transcriptional accessory protein [Synergistaceae bacterium]